MRGKSGYGRVRRFEASLLDLYRNYLRLLARVAIPQSGIYAVAFRQLNAVAAVVDGVHAELRTAGMRDGGTGAMRALELLETELRRLRPLWPASNRRILPPRAG